MSSNASDTTHRILKRTLYADRVIQETAYTNGLKNRVESEGDTTEGAIHYTTYHNIRNGSLITTPEERESYINSVPMPPPPIIVPDAPTSIIATPGIGQATVAFTIPESDGGATITSYTVTSNPGGFTATGPNSPLIVSGLADNTSYTFTVTATNSVGSSASSAASSPMTPLAPPANVPLPPVLTSVTFKTTDSMTIAFTQSLNGTPAITNYKYSLNGGAYTAFSPVDTLTPVVIPGLTSNTSYTIRLKAVNANGDSAASNELTETTYANVNYATFTNVGESSWTAPEGVTFVQYVIVGGGGGGGAAYSKITVLGNVLVTDIPQAGAYWINSANLTNERYSGRMYFGTTNTYQNSASFPDPIRLTASNNFTPSGVTYDYNKWYNTEIVYILTGALVMTTNWVPPYIVSSTYGANNISGGGGGGAGGQVRTLSGTSKYTVTPGQTYTIVVGAGGVGGIGGTNAEAAGNPGGSSTFDTITSAGGSGGGASRATGYTTNGFGNGGVGGQSYGNFVGGGGGGQTSANNYGRYNSAGPGANGTFINFGSGNIFYGPGGNGGVPNTVTTGTTAVNLGKGGAGTGATLNSYASGIDGGSGIVILRYYT